LRNQRWSWITRPPFFVD